MSWPISATFRSTKEAAHDARGRFKSLRSLPLAADVGRPRRKLPKSQMPKPHVEALPPMRTDSRRKGSRGRSLPRLFSDRRNLSRLPGGVRMTRPTQTQLRSALYAYRRKQDFASAVAILTAAAVLSWLVWLSI